MSTLEQNATPLDVELVRYDFPSIRTDLAYLDSVASSLTPQAVVDAMTRFYTDYRANVHRGSYDVSMVASDRFDAAIETIAAFIGAQADEVVITQNATLALNLAALSIPFQPGDEIILSNLEHTSNMAPWMRLAAEKDLQIGWYRTNKQGEFDLDAFEAILSSRTRVVALTWVSNITGSVVPVADVGKLCRDRGILFVVDASQAAPHVPIDVTDIACDFLAFSGHKMLGPTGAGVLYVRQELGQTLQPAILGGGTIDTTRCAAPSLEGCILDHCNFTETPHKWQAGTPPIAETLGLAAAVQYLLGIGFDAIGAHDALLVQQMMAGLAGIDGVTIQGPSRPSDHIGIVSFNVRGLPAEEVGHTLGESYGVAVRAGQHCAVNYFQEELRQATGQTGTVRASTYLYNTADEIDRLIRGVGEIAALMRPPK